MVVHLVGLGGSLEGRVAGVVLVLVGCRGDRRLVVIFVVAHVRILSFKVHVPLISSELRWSSSPKTPGLQKTEKRKRTGSKSGGERVDAVCDDQACNNRFSSPFSKVYPARARASHSSRVGGS
jgi:hypothetical protein